ncbi:protein AMBP-like [Rhincodon typus]|uniref:protein AMBP-like n=1 Tax=Rhincodon typus TaxID=259920 RepID=UPI00202ED81C|nr:protein AMBP-like [Rhincodon typus]
MRCSVVLLFAVLSLRTGAAVPLSETDYDQVQENFDLNQFLGTWFALATGCNCSWFNKYKDTMTIAKVTLSTSEESNKLIGKFEFDRNGTCDHVLGEYKIQDIPGHYVFNSTSTYESTADIRVIKTNYQEYAFFLLNTMEAVTRSESVALYGRTRKLRKEINDEFKDFALRHGIPEERVLFLPEKGACLPWDPIPESPVKKNRKRHAFGEQDEEGSVLRGFMSTIDTAGDDELLVVSDKVLLEIKEENSENNDGNSH